MKLRRVLFLAVLALSCCASMTGAPALRIVTREVPVAQINTAYASQLVATGGNRPYHWLSSPLPDGLALSDTGLLYGTPTVSGKFDFIVTITDSSKPKGKK